MLVSRSELSYYPEPEFQEKPKPVEQKKKRKVKKQNKKNRSSIKLIYIFMTMIFLGICLFILSRYADITGIRVDITNLERNKMELEKTKMDLVAELEGIKSSSKITEDAMLKLGMDYPDESQIVYVTVKENTIDDPIKNEFSIKNQIKKAFNKVEELF